MISRSLLHNCSCRAECEDRVEEGWREKKQSPEDQHPHVRWCAYRTLFFFPSCRSNLPLPAYWIKLCWMRVGWLELTVGLKCLHGGRWDKGRMIYCILYPTTPTPSWRQKTFFSYSNFKTSLLCPRLTTYDSPNTSSHYIVLHVSNLVDGLVGKAGDLNFKGTPTSDLTSDSEESRISGND